MKPKLLLRIAAAAMLFHLLGHSFGQSQWKNTNDPLKQGILDAMMGHSFPFMGAVHSMADYYEGYGWATSVGLLFFALVLWLLSGASKENVPLVRKLLIATTVCLFIWSADEFMFFFPFAACTTLLAALLSLASVFQLKKVA